jgi:hypothetical protein
MLRSIYRTIELSDGWNGRIIHTQVYFSEMLSDHSLVKLLIDLALQTS